MDALPREIRCLIWNEAARENPYITLPRVALVCKLFSQDVKGLKEEGSLLFQFLTDPRRFLKILACLLCHSDAWEFSVHFGTFDYEDQKYREMSASVTNGKIFKNVTVMLSLHTQKKYYRVTGKTSRLMGNDHGFLCNMLENSAAEITSDLIDYEYDNADLVYVRWMTLCPSPSSHILDSIMALMNIEPGFCASGSTFLAFKQLVNTKRVLMPQYKNTHVPQQNQEVIRLLTKCYIKYCLSLYRKHEEFQWVSPSASCDVQ